MIIFIVAFILLTIGSSMVFGLPKLKAHRYTKAPKAFGLTRKEWEQIRF